MSNALRFALVSAAAVVSAYYYSCRAPITQKDGSSKEKIAAEDRKEEVDKEDRKEEVKKEEKKEEGKRKIKAVLFDLDGTLVESVNIWWQLLKACVSHLKKKSNATYPELEYAVFAKTFGQPMEHNRDLFMPGESLDEITAFCNEHYGDYVGELVVIGEAERVVQDIDARTGGRICAVTNCPRPIAEIIMKSRPKLRELFAGKKMVCAGDDVSPLLSQPIPIRGKPYPDMIHEASRRLGVSPSDCIMVGDSRYDVESGVAAGCFTVGIKAPNGDININIIDELTLPAGADGKKRVLDFVDFSR